ncbi:coproporphyrinogen-III oxidase family protein [Phycisphaeraceae bacterium D3-23]
MASFALKTPISSVYLHLPFCFHKCHYCDFYSVVDTPNTTQPSNTDRQPAFTDALIAEVRRRAAQADIQPVTIFAGGGTPTYLRPDLWAKLLDCLREVGWLAGQSAGGTGILPVGAPSTFEFTVEANPETVTAELMQQLALGGVNRVSIGAQSFDTTSLKQLERWHDPDSVPRAVEHCRAAGITNLSLDLIFAIPGQTLAMLERDLDALLALTPTHLSTYGLTYEPNTPLTAKLRVGQVKQIDEDLEREMFELVLNKVEAAGFEHYEVSNWARREVNSEQSTVNSKDKTAHCSRFTVHRTKCAHNLAYWHNHDWLGLGPSAASHIQGHRWRNAPNLMRYIQDAPAPPIADHEHLPPAQRLGERIMLGLRLSEGLDADWLLNHPDLRDHQREAIDEAATLGFLEQTDGRIRLTRKGLFVADSVIAQVL